VNGPSGGQIGAVAVHYMRAKPDASTLASAWGMVHRKLAGKELSVLARLAIKASCMIRMCKRSLEARKLGVRWRRGGSGQQ